MAGKHVADLILTKPDAMGDDIVAFYGRKPPEYAVYSTAKRVLIHFADAPAAASKQRKDMVRLNPLRGEIVGLVDGWRSGAPGSRMRARAERYDRRVGDALVVGFEGDVAGAELLLKEIKADLLRERIAIGRIEYLVAAVVTMIVGLLIIALFTVRTHYDSAGLDLWRASAAGAVGALFSIAMGMRGRTILPDLQRGANITDAILRVVIGIIAAAVFVGLVRVGAVQLTIGDKGLNDQSVPWLAVLLSGFVAGFSERLVGDLLAKAGASTNVPPGRSEEPGAAAAGQGQSRSSTEAEQAQDEAGAPDTTDGGEEEDPHPEEGSTDACVADIEVTDDMVTADADLPAAAGGVAKPETGGGAG